MKILEVERWEVSKRIKIAGCDDCPFCCEACFCYLHDGDATYTERTNPPQWCPLLRGPVVVELERMALKIGNDQGSNRFQAEDGEKKS